MGSAGLQNYSALRGAQKCLCNIWMYYNATRVTETKVMVTIVIMTVVATTISTNITTEMTKTIFEFRVNKLISRSLALTWTPAPPFDH
jgi:hypothetical protein